MAHPMRSDVKDAINAKMRKMTMGYGSASGPKNNKLAPTNALKGEGPEEASGFGAEAGVPRPRADRASRLSNPVATYAKGGAVARATGGRTKKGKGATNVNVIIAPQGGGDKPPMPMPPPALAGPPPGAPPMPPKPPMGAGPMGGMPPGAAGLPMAPGAPGGMPPGLVPPRKRGGRVHEDAAQDKALIEKTLKDEGLVRERAAGGRMPHMTAGAASGDGRLEKIGKKPHDAGKPQAV